MTSLLVPAPSDCCIAASREMVLTRWRARSTTVGGWLRCRKKEANSLLLLLKSFSSLHIRLRRRSWLCGMESLQQTGCEDEYVRYE